MGFLRNRGLSDEEKARIPPGQHRVRDFPVLHVGDVPYRAAPDTWELAVWGEVENPMRWSLDQLRALPATEVTTDIHCVTSWSKLDTHWKGVSMPWLLDQIQPTSAAAHVLAHAEGGYTANVPLDALRDNDVLLAYEFAGRELELEHGRPLRLLVPKKYFWKSAKWLRGLEFLTEDRLGYWERYGYSNSADPWKEERYAF
ncbi:MAG: sulfite oxidase-like oxidoreductase [Thermoleophilia bacterium]|nr:sulfite oxidase-like oxidoreductase [Thermoleophilia bacterium]